MRKQIRVCDAKSSYATEAKANEAAKKQRQWTTQRLRAYECPMCGQWHLTKKAKRS